MSEYQRLFDEVAKRLVEVEDRLAKGKGTWPNPGYVQDITWDSWRGERLALRSVLFAAGLDPDIIIKKHGGVS